MAYDSLTQEWVYFRGGPKDDGWEIIRRHAQEWILPIPMTATLRQIEEEPMSITMHTGTYKFQGYRIVMENLLGALVPFRVFEWMGER